jgi:hypothetical protein
LAFNAASRGFITRYPKHLATLHLRSASAFMLSFHS